MAEGNGNQVFTDAAWAVWGPLVEAVRPKGKTPPKELGRTISAIFWRHQNGAKWRAIPAELGPWWLAAQLFIRWAKQGVWELIGPRAGERRRSRPLHGISRRDQHTGARESSGGGEKGGTGESRDEREVRRFRFAKRRLGRSRGGYGTKAVAVADAQGRAVAFVLAPGQAHEAPLAPGLLDILPEAPGWVVGDRGLSSESLREQIWDMGAQPAIPAKRNDASLRCSDFIYIHRNRIERLWGRLKEWRAVATRYEKTASSFLGVLCLSAAQDWLKSIMSKCSGSNRA